jgi:hypothetical protein
VSISTSTNFSTSLDEAYRVFNIVLLIYHVPHSNLDIAKSTGGLNHFASSIGITGSSRNCDSVQTEPSGAVDERDVPWMSRGKLFLASFKLL